MSGSGKRTVKFEAANKAKKGDIPTTVAPNAVAMGGGQDGAERTQAEFQALPIRDPQATDEQFPTDALTQETEEDKLMSAKLQLGTPAAGGAPTGVTPFGRLIAKDSDFEWLNKKREKEAEANLQQWFASNFDKMTPEAKAMARKLWPSFYQQRLALLDKDLNLLREVARQKVTGITSREDLLRQYAMEAGYIDMDRLNNLANPERAALAQNRAVARARYRRGLLNPNRLPRGAETSRSRPYNEKAILNRANASNASNLGAGNMGFNVQGVNNFIDEHQPQNRALLANLPV